MPYFPRLSFCSEDLPVREEDGCWGDVHAATRNAAAANTNGTAERLPSSVPSPIDQSKIEQLLRNVDYGSSNNEDGEEMDEEEEEEEEDESRAKEDILAGKQNSEIFLVGRTVKIRITSTPLLLKGLKLILYQIYWSSTVLPSPP